VSSETILWLLCNLAAVVVIGLLAYRRVWNSLPIFFTYSIWSLMGNTAAMAVLHWYPPTSATYVNTYLLDTTIDSALMFGVLVELAWSVLRPIRASLPSGTLLVLAGCVFSMGLAIWALVSVPGHLPRKYALLVHLLQTSSILQIVVFLVLISTSQMFSLGWRNREMQIATGFGFNSLVNMAAAMLRTHMSSWAQYGYVNRFIVASYLATLLYWVISFAQKEPERRQFTPEMQRILLAAAGAARTARVTFDNQQSGKTKE